MYKIKNVLYNINEDNYIEESDGLKYLICFVCNNKINYGQVYFSDEQLKVYCSKKCYLEELKLEYY